MNLDRESPMSPAREQELASRFSEPEDNYNLLREGAQSQRQTSSVMDQLDTDGILQQYVKFADKMVGVADGSIEHRDIIDPNNPELSTQKPDFMIFLDKSARPVADLMTAFWGQFAEDGVEMPDIDFLNIDRVNWFMDQGYSRTKSETVLGPSDFDIDKVSDRDIAAIRSLFVTGDISEDNWQEEVMNMPTILDGKNIVIVDEVKSQGGTLSIATKLIRRAIPGAVVSGQYFWETSYRQLADEKLKADSVPVWYSKENPFGRGIGDVSKAYHETMYEQEPSQENLRRKIGWSVLSAPHHRIEKDGSITYEDDWRYAKLKQDIAYLTYAVADGRILRTPDSNRPDDERIDIIEAQGLALREATTWRTSSKRIQHRVKNSPQNRK